MNAVIGTRETTPVSLGNWILTLIVLAIPIVGLVMLFVWAFSSGTHPSKQSYCRAVLVFGIIVMALVLVVMIMGGFAAMTAMHGMGGATL